MRDFFFNQKLTKLLASFLLVTSVVLLTGCSDNTGGTSSGATNSGTTTPAATASISLVLTDPISGGVVTSVSNGTSANVNATVINAGLPVANTVVTFKTDATMATMNPSSGTALTNSAGVATITLTGGGAAGATTISASTQVGGAAASGSIGYSVGATSVTISLPTFGANPLSAYGTTSVTATVTGGGSGSQTVNFSSGCSSSGKAALSTGITTILGVATGSYRDNGCASTDTITATVSGGLATNSATLVVTPPTTGSIQYVSSVPSNISLKGTGGTEVSKVSFKVLDTGNNPISGRLVTFGLSTTAGGIILTPGGTATSDANGVVVTNVNAGTVSTPVRVTASTCSTATNPCTGTVLTTQSSQLTVTTGIPDQYGFSLAAATHNIEGWSTDGTKSVLSARLADHFKNPVPDGTAVVFTSEGAAVDGQCVTTSGICTVTFTSQNGRPTNGRVTVLASAVGEETFTDVNGNGWADLVSGKTPANEMIDPNGNPTDLPEAFVDYNENGVLDPGEPFKDFNQNGNYDAADGKFSGVLCDDVTSGRSSAGTCSATHSIDVRQTQVIVLSSSTPSLKNMVSDPIVLPPCNTTNGDVPYTFHVTVVDLNGNAMPAGTKVEFSTDNGKITSPASYIQPDTIACRSNKTAGVPDYPGCPTAAGVLDFGDIPVTMKSDAAFTAATATAAAVCTNATPSGTFTVKVTSPGGLITTVTANITD